MSDLKNLESLPFAFRRSTIGNKLDFCFQLTELLSFIFLFLWGSSCWSLSLLYSIPFISNWGGYSEKVVSFWFFDSLQADYVLHLLRSFECARLGILGICAGLRMNDYVFGMMHYLYFQKIRLRISNSFRLFLIRSLCWFLSYLINFLVRSPAITSLAAIYEANLLKFMLTNIKTTILFNIYPIPGSLILKILSYSLSIFTVQYIIIEYEYNILQSNKHMRSSRNMRLVTSDLRKIQKSVSDKVDKDVNSLRQLMQLPDFDVSQFFQTLAKSAKPEEVLQKISEEKKIDFFSRNYLSFIETQETLSMLQLPHLQEIPKAKKFNFEEPDLKSEEQRFEESTVIEIVDNFSVSVLQKKIEDTVKFLDLIKEMKAHEKYRQHFNVFSIQQIFRESYETFLENCEDNDVLIKIGEPGIALKKFLKQKTNQLMTKVRADLYVDNSAQTLKKIMHSLVNFIGKILQQSKQEYSSSIIDQTEVSVILAKWISDVTQEFYHNIESSIYEKEEVSDVLEALDVILETSTDFQSKGVNLSKDLKSLISDDLPAHMNKIVEVVVEAFEDILSDDNQLYEFKYFDGLSSFSFLEDILIAIKQKDYGKKCCSKKGIMLINSFVIILEPLCDNKWIFLHGNVIGNLLQKISNTILTSNWPYWDYFQLFHFFERLKNGKVKHKRLFDPENLPTPLKQRIKQINQLNMYCWETFEEKVTKMFWVQVLCKIPQLLLQIKPYLQTKSEIQSLKPTLFSMDLIFKLNSFLKIIQFRLQRPQFEHLVIRFYQYVLYTIEYILYWEYHHHGQKQKVFLLYKISDRILKKAKMFAIDQIEALKESKGIMTIGRMTGYGVEIFALDIYFLTEALKSQTEYQKLNCDKFLQKVAEIEAKQHKSKPMNIQQQKFMGGVQKFLTILKNEPEKIKNYIESKRNPNKK